MQDLRYAGEDNALVSTVNFLYWREGVESGSAINYPPLGLMFPTVPFVIERHVELALRSWSRRSDAGVAWVACYMPARKATKVDPMIALRYE